jgi:YebC/PmpR family DNA-binding regulatory protein
MSGHSKWSTIKREKGAKDAKRGAVFTKLGNQIAIAARSGTDISMNPGLALAVEKAKAANMPMANIQRAIDRVADKNAATFEEVTYEAYGPGGIAILIETATDNKNRTYPEVRTAITKHGGTIADAGSVVFQFSRKGEIIVKELGDEALLTALDAGAEDAREEDGELFVYTDAKELHSVLAKIKEAGLTVKEAGLTYVASADVPITDEETAGKIIRLFDAIDDQDDVVNVHSNADIQVDVD